MSLDYGSVADAITYDGTVNLRDVAGTFVPGAALSADGVAFATAGTLTDNRTPWIWFHEKGFTEDGGPRSWSLMGAYRSVEGGQIIVNGVRPDTDDLQGGYAITFAIINRDVRGKFSRTYPAINITSATGQKSCRVQGEQVSVMFSGNSAPTYWRMGNMQFDYVISGRKR